MLHYGVQPEKCLYGTDWPIASMESYLDFMEELKMPPRDRTLMMYENRSASSSSPSSCPWSGHGPSGGSRALPFSLTVGLGGGVALSAKGPERGSGNDGRTP